MKKILLAAAVLALAGCDKFAPLPTYQNYAGINRVSVDYCFEEESIATAVAAKIEGITSSDVLPVIEALPVSWAPCDIEIIDGKERKDVSFALVTPDGTGFEYNAGEEKAFEGQALRAEVDRIQSEILGEVFPALTEAIINAINPAPNLDLGGGDE